MSQTWDSETPPPGHDVSGLDWLRILWRGGLIILLIAPAFALQMALRLLERPLFGGARPMTPYITKWVCRACLWAMGLRVKFIGKPMTTPGGLVANHSSWLDIFVLNACATLYFVAKAEIASWPGIGLLARGTGTVFIARDRREAKAQTALFEERLGQGHRLLFFPEGTSTDGLRVLPFKSTLFAAFFAENLPENLCIQPVSVTYHAPQNTDPRWYGWWGDMSFGAHLFATLATPKQGYVEVRFHDPLPIADAAGRKALSQAAFDAVLAGHGLASKETV